MQTAPGIYDERLLSGLDYAVAAAAQRGIRVSLVLGDWWKYSGGARQYLSWCGEKQGQSQGASCTSRGGVERVPAGRRALSTARPPGGP
jgi:hypothetical protein